MKSNARTPELKNESTRLPLGVLVGIALITGCILLLEISLTRYFSFKLWYHYAFMIISIALLGLGTSSTALALVRQRLIKIPVHRVLACCALLCGIFTIIDLPLLTQLSDSWVRNTSGSYLKSFLIISSYWIVLFIPFFFAGSTVSWAIFNYARKISAVYAFDLLGASFGCLLSVWLLSYFHPEQAISFSAAIAFGSSLSFFISQKKYRNWFLALVVPCMFGAIILAFYGDFLVRETTTPSKGLSVDLKTGGRIIATRPCITGRVDVIENSEQRFAWGLVKDYRGYFPQQLTARIDGDALTVITQYDGDFSKWAFTNYMPSSLPFFLGTIKKVLVIGPGGGMDVVNAIGRGAKEVTGVEINARIIELVKDDFAEFSGRIYHDPRVQIIHSDGRNFVENTPEQYDLIQLNFVDTFAAISSGALSVSEDYLYTTEAFRSYIDALNSDGYLVLGRTTYEILPLTAMVHAATRGKNLNIANHIFIADNPMWNLSLVFLFKKTPLTNSEIEKGISFLKQANLRLVYAPQHEKDSNPDVVQLLQHPDRELFIQTYSSDITPETDDKPFYFRASKWTSLLGTYTGGKGNLLIILSVSIIFALTFIVVPLLISSRKAIHNNGLYLWFFTFIGMGYIILEMALMVKFSLFLGHPVRSLTVTLFALLFSSGLGSYCSRIILGKRLKERWKKLIPIQTLLPFVGICLIGIAYGFYLPEIFSMWMGLSLIFRVVLSVVLIAPLGFIMGMPLPIGMTLLESKERSLIIWAWGLNGVASVIGSILCIVLAHLMGYRMTFLFSALCYLSAVFCLIYLQPGYQKSKA